MDISNWGGNWNSCLLGVKMRLKEPGWLYVEIPNLLFLQVLMQ